MRGNSKNWTLWLGVGVALFAVFCVIQGARAYETYHDPAQDGDGYCASCHPGFPSRGDTHDMHQDFFTSDCNNCHTGSGRGNPYIMWSVNGYGCTGCHGRDYGETSEQTYDNGVGSINPANAAKMSGYGLRKQHLNKGQTVCLDCHADVAQSFIKPENELPPLYPGEAIDPCNADGSEDGTPELNGEDLLGLDNDGDTLIDGADPDCGAPVTPGETSGSAFAPVLVTAHDKNNEILSFSYESACGAIQNTIHFGPLDQVSTYGYSGEVCTIGDSGTYDWGYSGAPASFFFLVVGNDGAVEGSYGLSRFPETERPRNDFNAVCPLPQDFSARCD